MHIYVWEIAHDQTKALKSVYKLMDTQLMGQGFTPVTQYNSSDGQDSPLSNTSHAVQMLPGDEEGGNDSKKVLWLKGIYSGGISNWIFEQLSDFDETDIKEDPRFSGRNSW